MSLKPEPPVFYQTETPQAAPAPVRPPRQKRQKKPERPLGVPQIKLIDKLSF